MTGGGEGQDIRIVGDSGDAAYHSAHKMKDTFGLHITAIKKDPCVYRQVSV